MKKAITHDSLCAKIERLLSPGLSWCGRCGRPWKHPASRRVDAGTRRQLGRDRFYGLVGVTGHATEYDDGRGCFPLCEGCWSLLTPAERLPYYQELWGRWQAYSPEYAEWGKIADAVLAGK